MSFNRSTFIETLEPRRMLTAGDLLPDLVPSASALNHWRFGASPMWEGSRTLIRFDNLVANIGQGPLEVAADQIIAHPVSGQTITVSQRIANTSGQITTRPAGIMEFHDEGSHHHFHFEDFAHYTLRAVAPGGGPGEVVRSGNKAGFCLGDSAIVQQSRPDRPPFPHYTECYPVGGISVGWADLYDQTIDFQWIDVTGLPNGQYYLESTADPDDRLLESDESNNTTRTLINLIVPKFGDATGDGKVDKADVKIVLQNMNRSGMIWSTGDFTGDGKVNFADYQVVELGFNRPSPVPAAAAASATAPKPLPARRPDPVLEPISRGVMGR
jgi:hypothetical protein